MLKILKVCVCIALAVSFLGALFTVYMSVPAATYLMLKAIFWLLVLINLKQLLNF